MFLSGIGHFDFLASYWLTRVLLVGYGVLARDKSLAVPSNLMNKISNDYPFFPFEFGILGYVEIKISMSWSDR